MCYNVKNEHMQEKNTLVWLAVLFVVALAAIAAGYLLGTNRQPSTPKSTPTVQVTPAPATPYEEEAVFCTMDAKICPDGSSVGRVPPNCEFSPCPGEDEEREGAVMSSESSRLEIQL
jgi:hypothetical protein